MHWIQTYTGRKFYPLKPSPADVDIRDIAHALSLLCRFNGHCRTFYSVAEHCVRVSHELTDSDALWGLLHDAAEAYVTDLPRPVKARIPEFVLLEDAVLTVVLGTFGLSMPMPEAVRIADDRLLGTEARDLMADPPEVWSFGDKPLPGKIEPMSANEAERAFLVPRHDHIFE